MSLLAIGLSHRSTPVELLERVVVDGEAIIKLLADLVAAEHVDEALVLATCNRLEVHAEVSKFHGGVQEVSEQLAAHTGVDLETLTEHLYVHYEDRAVQHLFAVAAGLDSMVVGEQQILGQLRARAEPRPRRAGASAARSGRSSTPRCGSASARTPRPTSTAPGARWCRSASAWPSRRSAIWRARRAVVVGAGSMSSLAATELRRARRRRRSTHRQPDARARRAAGRAGRRTGRWRWPRSTRRSPRRRHRRVVHRRASASSSAPRRSSTAAGRRSFVLDLALPRDVDPAAADAARRHRRRPRLARCACSRARRSSSDVDAVRRIVTDEVGALPRQAARRPGRADRGRAARTRAAGRRCRADPPARPAAATPTRTVTRELRTTVERVVDKLLHAPTVRVKELAEEPGGDSYAEALRELFALDPSATEAVARAAVVVESSRGRRHDGAAPWTPCGSAPAAPRWRSRSPARSPSASRRRPRRRAGRGRHRRRPLRGRGRRASAAPGSSSPSCASGCSTATSTSRSTPTRTCRPSPPTARAGGGAAPGRPARRARRARRFDARRAARRHPRRHRFAAPGGAAARARVRPRGRADPRQRRHPAAARSPTVTSTPSSSPPPGCSGSAASTRPARSSTPARCCRRPRRARWRSSAAPPTTALVAALAAALDDPHDAVGRRRRARPAGRPRSRLQRASRRARRRLDGRRRRRRDLPARRRRRTRRQPHHPAVHHRAARRRPSTRQRLADDLLDAGAADLIGRTHDRHQQIGDHVTTTRTKPSLAPSPSSAAAPATRVCSPCAPTEALAAADVVACPRPHLDAC